MQSQAAGQEVGQAGGEVSEGAPRAKVEAPSIAGAKSPAGAPNAQTTPSPAASTLEGLQTADATTGAAPAVGEAQTNADPVRIGHDALAPRTADQTTLTARVDAERLAVFAAKFAQKVADGSTRFQMRLDPPELGRIEVKVVVDAEGVVRAHVTAERPEALADLSRHARTLERALSDSGVDLADDGVSFSLADHGGFADARPDRDDNQGGARQDANAARSGQGDTAPALSLTPATGLVEVDTRLGFAILRPARVDLKL